MPRLILLRHATAERAGPGESDHDRALTKGGREGSDGGRPDARRARRGDRPRALLRLDADARDLGRCRGGDRCKAGGAVPALAVRGERLSADPEDRRAARPARSSLIGHNPAMHGTAIEIAVEPFGARWRTASRAGFPKGALAMFEFDGEWKSLAARARCASWRSSSRRRSSRGEPLRPCLRRRGPCSARL